MLNVAAIVAVFPTAEQIQEARHFGRTGYYPSQIICKYRPEPDEMKQMAAAFGNGEEDEDGA